MKNLTKRIKKIDYKKLAQLIVTILLLASLILAPLFTVITVL